MTQPTGKFTTENIHDLELFALVNDLDTITPNSLIGFETFEDAQEVASLLKGKIVQFRKQHGDRKYTNYGEVDEPLTCYDYAKDMGDDCMLVGTEWINHYQDELSLLMEKFETEEASELKKAIEIAKEKFDACPDGHSVLMTAYELKTPCTFAPLFGEYVKNVMMSFHSDVTSYAIGVQFDSDPFDSE